MVYMDSSAGQHKEMGGNSLENMLVCSKQNNQQQQENRKARPQQEEALKCPRCDSINTKFCYYNNYSLTQPRYFCKSCRRYWTKGGTLRNVPVGGGCRKNKRSSSSSSISSNSSSTSSSSSLLRKPQIDHLINSSSNPSLLSSLIPPNLTYDSNDLTLAFARLHQKHSNGQHLGFHDDDQNQNQNHDLSILGNPNGSSFLGFLENQNNFQNGFYGYDNHNGEIMENHHHHHHHMVLPNYDQHRDQDYVSSSTSSPATTTTTSAAAQILGVSNVTTMKQELICNNNYGREIDDDQSKILWGFPWQNINGNGSINSDFDSAGIREISSTWSNIHGGISSNWHGVLNTPLMY